MSAIDVVNRVFREFKRYTGDGLPGEPVAAPLPIGDPSSGVNNPKKSEMRTALLGPLQEFRQGYLGAFPSDPTTDLDGGALIEGATYFNSTTGLMRVYHLGAWQNSATALADDDVTEPKLDPSLTNLMTAVVANRAALKALDTTRYTLAEQKDIGEQFAWDGADQSANIVTHTATFASANAGSEEILMLGVTSTSVAANTLTFAAPHGIATGTRITPQNSVNTMSAGGDYYAIAPTTTTLKFAANAVAAAANQALTIGATTQVMTIRLVHELQTGDAVYQETTVNGLMAYQIAFVIVLANYYIQLAATYADAVASPPVPINLTGTAAMTLKTIIDPRQGQYVTKTGDLPTGVSGAYVITGERYVTPYQMGATGRGLVDDSAAFQAAINYAFEKRLPLRLEPGEFLFDFPTRLITTKTSHHLNRLGINIEGAGRQNVLLKQSAIFPASGYFFNDDANPYNLSDQNIGVIQGPHTIGGFSMEGKGYLAANGGGGIRYRGLSGGYFDDISASYFGGDAFHQSGTTVSTKDDVDTSDHIVLNNIRIEQTAGYGFYGADARGGSIKFDSCLFQRNDKGNRVSPAGFTAINNIFNLCGNAANPTAAALAIAQSATAAELRAISITGNMFESSYLYDLALERISGGVVQANAFHPFRSAAGTAQRGIDVGLTSASGVTIQGNRWQPIANGGLSHNIDSVHVRATSDNVHLIGNSVASIGIQPVVKDVGATNIYNNYATI